MGFLLKFDPLLWIVGPIYRRGKNASLEEVFHPVSAVIKIVP